MVCEAFWRYVKPCDAVWNLVMQCEALWWCVRPCDGVWGLVMVCEAFWCYVKPCDAVWSLVLLCEALWWCVRACDAVWWLACVCVCVTGWVGNWCNAVMEQQDCMSSISEKLKQIKFLNNTWFKFYKVVFIISWLSHTEHFSSRTLRARNNKLL